MSMMLDRTSCPKCYARRGDPCVTRWLRLARKGYPHYARILADATREDDGPNWVSDLTITYDPDGLGGA